MLAYGRENSLIARQGTDVSGIFFKAWQVLTVRITKFQNNVSCTMQKIVIKDNIELLHFDFPKYTADVIIII